MERDIYTSKPLSTSNPLGFWGGNLLNSAPLRTCSFILLSLIMVSFLCLACSK